MNDEVKRTIYVDLDGVLCDFDRGFIEITGMSPESVDDNELWSRISAHGKSRFFSELPWMPGGQELWQFVTQNFLQVKILTALGKSDAQDKQTSTGKRQWLQKNIPDLQDSDIIMVANKHRKRHYSKPNDILVDDTKSTIQEWIKKGGIGILHKISNDTMRELQKYV
jgi:5'(3')-deoxyribonucleotidase